MGDIANNIRELRKKKDLSQEQLAQLLHVTRQTVSAWERGVARPGLDTLGEIARVLETEPEQLLYGTAPSQKPVYRTISSAPVLAVFPLYLLFVMFILPIPMFALLGNGGDGDTVFILCGQIFLALELALCCCLIKDDIKNRDYYAQLDQEGEEKE